jgi:hypothetical protein
MIRNLGAQKLRTADMERIQTGIALPSSHLERSAFIDRCEQHLFHFLFRSARW